MINYEKFKHEDANFLITFHPAIDTIKHQENFGLHWHEHMEVLYFFSGNATVLLNQNSLEAKEGELIIVNSNTLHTMVRRSKDCIYDCLVLDKRFCNEFFPQMESLRFDEKICDQNLENIILGIRHEIKEKEVYYKERVKAYSLELLVLLARNFSKALSINEEKAAQQKREFIKPVIQYITAQYTKPVTLDEIASHVGISKYYLCHAFKEVTGQTLMDYINVLRCNYARGLLSSGKCNVSESALASGFQNFSYFTKAYKKYMGRAPSQDLLHHTIVDRK